MYTRDGGLILKDGVVLSTVEIVDLLNKLQKVSDKWDKLDEEVGNLYEEEGNLCDIGELCALKFRYL